MIYFLLGFLLALFLWLMFYIVAIFNPVVQEGYKNSICYGIINNVGGEINNQGNG